MDVLKSIFVWFVGILYMIVFFPVTFVIWLLVLPFDRDRRVIHRILMYQSLIFCRIMPIWKISVEGRNKAEKGITYVIISNHQSILDILLINSLLYRFKWVSKVENMKVPILGWYLRMAGYISVDRGNRESKDEMMEESQKCLENGTSVMLFPEGTRSADGEISFFKRGAFQLAIATGRPILPVLIDGTGGILPKHGLIFGSGYRIRIRVLDPVQAESFGTDDHDVVAMKFSNFMREELKKLRTTLP